MNAEQLYKVLRQRAGKSLIADEIAKLLVANGSAVVRVYLGENGEVVTETIKPREFFTGSFVVGWSRPDRTVPNR